jgi:NADPH-dependent 2,4-dienoyl-CoA reductase/sulfur reductase-like enzyme
MSRRSLDLVIVGNGAAAAEAALAIRGAGYRGDLDLFADNSNPPYNPMLGTYYASAAIPVHQCFPYGGAEFYDRYRIRARLDTRVVRLDPVERNLTTADGCRYTYRKCLVASGASTVFPSTPGLDSPGVLGLRSFDDAVRLKNAVAAITASAAAASRPARGLVLGASFAGIKVATILRRAGMDVCIVEREETVLPLVVHPACARVIERHLQNRAHVLRLGTTLESVEAAAGRLRARFRSGAGGEKGSEGVGEEEVDLILVCIGSRPSLALLQASEVAAETGLIVDEHMQTSVSDLFAAGDVAQAFDPVSGAREVVARWSNARRQGRVAGLNMAGVHAEYPGSIPCNIQHVGDLLFASGGSMRGCDKVDVTSNGHGVTALAFEGGRLVGFNLLGDVRPAGPLVQALARRTGTNRPVADTAEAWMRRITWTSVNVS